MANGINIVRARQHPKEPAMAQSVLDGLHKTPKELSPVWLYDELGSQLFDRICDLPEYYVTRTEMAIMEDHAPEMARLLGARIALIEFGSGSSDKTRALLDYLENPCVYVPVDIERNHLLEAAVAIARDYPALAVSPLCADFTKPLELPRQAIAADRQVVYFPGSTLGNFESEEAKALLRSIREIIQPDGALLIGIDLKKDVGVLERAYDDAQGVTAEFNLNALRHLNRVMDCDMPPDAFEHQAVWVEGKDRIEMRLVSQRDLKVDVAGESIPLRRGEYLRTECCHKYTLESFAALAAAAGLKVRHTWCDAERKFSVQMLVVE